jgi:hypothetical protein
MPLSDRAVPSKLLWPTKAPWPRRRARWVMHRFEACFAAITYDMDLEVGLANAQAFVAQRSRRVRLYGGLVRHRRIGLAGLALVLAHETGHHLAGPPYLAYYPWLSSEERATEWAVTVGLEKVFGMRARHFAYQGSRQLRAIGIRLD